MLLSRLWLGRHASIGAIEHARWNYFSQTFKDWVLWRTCLKQIAERINSFGHFWVGKEECFSGFGRFFGKNGRTRRTDEEQREKMREKLRETCEMPKETNANRRERKERTHARTRATDRRPEISGSSDESRKVYSRHARGLLNNSADAKVVRRPNQNFFSFSFLIF